MNTGEIVSLLTGEIQQFSEGIRAQEIGRVIEVGDGIARVYGLGGVMAGEMVEFTRTGTNGLAFNLEENSVGIIILGEYLEIKEGDEVRSTSQLLEVPVGDALVGRVVNPLGQPLDGKGEIVTTEKRYIETAAPGVADRQPVETPLQTGIKAIDAMIPIGRGQRELIIGDRKTGKTAIAIDAIINQKDAPPDERVICVYVAVGQKQSSVASLVQSLEHYGAMDYTIVVSAASSDPAPLQYIAPYAGCAMAEHYMHQGRDTLVVYDDLTKQAAAYRQLSLLMRRPPGREAYPGDVFYAHSRLLERSARLADKWVIVPNHVNDAEVKEDWGVNNEKGEMRQPGEAGKVYVGPLDKEKAAKDVANFPDHKVAKVAGTGGSLTALPIIETQEGEVSAYIPTNVISITDGQIYLQPDLFFAGVRPAVDVGISVSRVGGKAQIPPMKKIAGSLRLDLAAFRALEAFAQLGTELDKATQSQLDRGYRMVEILKQPQFQPMNVADQVAVIFAGTKGYLDKIPVSEVPGWEQQFLAFLLEQKPELRDAIRSARKLTDELQEQLRDALQLFQGQYQPPRTTMAETAGGVGSTEGSQGTGIQEKSTGVAPA